MLILSVNVGSSSLKLDLWDMAAVTRRARLEAKGIDDCVTLWQDGNSVEASGRETHVEALETLLKRLPDSAVERTGHRLVHGGESFRRPVWLSDRVLQELDDLAPLSPLHLPSALQVARRCRELLPGAAHAGVFDTAFHANLPPHAYTYALPAHLRSRYRRFGFHGIACADVVRQRGPHLRAKAAILHLGAGCSATALQHGISVDTTMGYTPLEGLVMATRSGDVDPGVLLHLIGEGGAGADGVTHMLQSQSGLLGLSGRSGDMRELLARRDLPEVDLAITLFCYRAAKAVAAMAVPLQGLEELMFSGGIGENSTGVREEICRHLGWLGVKLDAAANEAGAERISAVESRVTVHVVRVDEGREIALQTAALDTGSGR